MTRQPFAPGVVEAYRRPFPVRRWVGASLSLLAVAALVGFVAGLVTGA